jgi:hypothetical protein
MSEPRAQRTLVKSPPELWAEVSDLEALARHLGEFGEIRITRLEPETTVAWEGDRARGTVHLEPSGWGTKVTLTAELEEPPPAGAPEPEPEPLAATPEPEPVATEPLAPEPEQITTEAESLAAEPELDREPIATGPDAAEAPTAEAPRQGFFARLFGRRPKVEPAAEVEADAPPPEPEPEPIAEAAPPEAASPEPEPEPVAEAGPPGAAPPEPEPDPEPVAEAAPPEPKPVAEAVPPTNGALDGERAEAILTGVLDDLGSAHHRPFSRG